MHRLLRLCTLSIAVVLLLAAADFPWKNKPLSRWDETDAKHVLTDSPWVRYVSPQPVRDLSPAERRDGGDMDAGIGKGVGLAGIGLFGPQRQAEALARAHAKPDYEPVAIRWESALPVRVAEQKANETDAPVLDGDDYAIAVYRIPTPNRWNLAHELRGVAFIRRANKKDLKPSRVKILRQTDGTATIVYLFPRKVEITKKDGQIEFAAQIDRLFVSRNFYTEDMLIQGELELLMPSNGLQ